MGLRLKLGTVLNMGLELNMEAGLKPPMKPYLLYEM